MPVVGRAGLAGGRDDGRQPASTITSGVVIEICPPKAHMHLLDASSAGMPRRSTVATPGVQGVVTGTQGIGVSTPSAAAVAAATVGLAGERHMPNVGMFTIGAQSMMFAPGGVAAVTVHGRTVRQRQAQFFGVA